MAFQAQRTLRFGACDPSGIAYFPAYLDLLVGVMEDFFASLGWPWPDMIAKHRIGTPTLKLDILFAQPGFFGDALVFNLAVVGLGRSSLDLHHEIFRGETLLWSARQRIVGTSLDTHTSTPWPPELRTAITAILESDNA